MIDITEIRAIDGIVVMLVIIIITTTSRYRHRSIGGDIAP
jgi:hypothetical protein